MPGGRKPTSDLRVSATMPELPGFLARNDVSQRLQSNLRCVDAGRQMSGGRLYFDLDRDQNTKKSAFDTARLAVSVAK